MNNNLHNFPVKWSRSLLYIYIYVYTFRLDYYMNIYFYEWKNFKQRLIFVVK